MRVWIPTLTRKVAALYFCVSLDLSSTARTLMPRLCASMNALAIGAEVKLYACTRICWVAAFTSRTTASVAPPCGEKYTATRADVKSSARATLVSRMSSPRLRDRVEGDRWDIGHLQDVEDRGHIQ